MDSREKFGLSSDVYNLIPRDNEPKSGITITYNDGSSITEDYIDMGRRYCNADGTMITLYFKHGLPPVSIVGNNLQKLVEPLRYKSVPRLYPFDPQSNKKTLSKDDKEPPVIERIFDVLPEEG